MPYARTEDEKARSRRHYLRDTSYFVEKHATWKQKNPKKYAYLGQRHTSKQRGIEFNLTFEEFVEFWGNDFERRGTGYGQLQMGRYGDVGAYEVGNIYMVTKEENSLGPRYKEEAA